jgi:hypothetical protein
LSASGGADNLTLKGLVYSDSGNIHLSAGEHVVINVDPSAPNGSITVVEHLNSSLTGVPSGLIPLPPPPPLYGDPASRSAENSLGYAAETTVVASAAGRGEEGDKNKEHEESGKDSGSNKSKKDDSDAKHKKQYCN